MRAPVDVRAVEAARGRGSRTSRLARELGVATRDGHVVEEDAGTPGERPIERAALVRLERLSCHAATRAHDERQVP